MPRLLLRARADRTLFTGVDRCSARLWTNPVRHLSRVPGWKFSIHPYLSVVSYALVGASLTGWPTASCAELRERAGRAGEVARFQGSWKVRLVVRLRCRRWLVLGKKHCWPASSGWSLPKPLLCPPARAAALLLLCCRAPVCCGQWPLAVEHTQCAGRGSGV